MQTQLQFLSWKEEDFRMSESLSEAKHIAMILWLSQQSRDLGAVLLVLQIGELNPREIKGMPNAAQLQWERAGSPILLCLTPNVLFFFL